MREREDECLRQNGEGETHREERKTEGEEKERKRNREKKSERDRDSERKSDSERERERVREGERARKKHVRHILCCKMYTTLHGMKHHT